MAAALLVAFGAGVVALAGESADAPGRGERPAREGGSFVGRLVPGGSDRDREEVDPRLAARLRRLSLEEKAGQVMIVGFDGDDDDLSVIARRRRESYGGLVLERAGAEGPSGVSAFSTALRAEGGGGPAPLLLTTQEGGRFSAIPALPPDRAPGDTALREAEGAVASSARALRDLGIDGVLGPVVDVGPEDGGALGERAFSDDPRKVAALARDAVRAYRRAGLLSAPKHFPGLGAASASTEEEAGSVGLSIEDLRRRDLGPFRAAIKARAPAIVVGHGLYGTDDFVTPASQSRFIIEDLLRRELGFEGLVISDDLTAGAITTYGNPADAAVASIRAGVDLVHVAGSAADQAEVKREIVRAVRRKKLEAARLDEAVLSVLEAKRRAR